MVFRRKLFHHRPLCKSHVVLVCRNDFMRIFLCSFLNHLEQRRLHFLPVDDERTAENLMTAMLGIDLCETEHLRIRQLTPQLAFHLMQVFDFLWRKSQSFLFVIFFQILYIHDGSRLDINRKNILVQTLIHTLQHRIVPGMFIFHWEILFYTRNTAEAHVLSNLNGIRTPRSNHLTTRTYETTFQSVFGFHGGTTVKPT